MRLKWLRGGGVAWGGIKKVAITAITTIKSALATFLPMAVFALNQLRNEIGRGEEKEAER